MFCCRVEHTWQGEMTLWILNRFLHQFKSHNCPPLHYFWVSFYVMLFLCLWKPPFSFSWQLSASQRAASERALTPACEGGPAALFNMTSLHLPGRRSHRCFVYWGRPDITHLSMRTAVSYENFQHAPAFPSVSNSIITECAAFKREIIHLNRRNRSTAAEPNHGALWFKHHRFWFFLISFLFINRKNIQ